MWNEVNINYIIVITVLGAVGLAAIYHTVLFIHRRTKLLSRYSIYLWLSFLYILYRFLYPNTDHSSKLLEFFNLDESLQMISFAAYIYFLAVALDLDKERERRALFYVKLSPWVIFLYILLQIILINVHGGLPLYLWAKVAIRTYLLFFGLYFLLAVVLKRKQIYYSYIAAGAISMIVFGVISSIVNIIDKGKIDYMVKALSWLMMGFFTDVIFFSSAIGYRIKTDSLEKETALRKLILQNNLLQQKEIEKILAIHKTREDERKRIAGDLHDDLGASLSSLQIYSAIAGESLQKNPEKVQEMLGKISRQSKLLMENMGDIVWSMNTAEGLATTLETRIKNYGAELLADSAISVSYQIAPESEKTLKNIAARKNVLLLLKEAINNTAKYSYATSVIISVILEGEAMVITIADNGIGFNPQEVQAGNGLKNMQHRVLELSGSFDLASSPGGGTTIKAVIPIAMLTT